MRALTIYSRPGCHLCDDMKAVVKRAVNRLAQTSSEPIAVDEVDITTDAQLESLYGLEIPVLLLDGRKIAKYRIGEDELRRVLTGRAGGAGGAG